jgi:hypothetical protein
MPGSPLAVANSDDNARQGGTQSQRESTGQPAWNEQLQYTAYGSRTGRPCRERRTTARCKLSRSP